jgi:hypothetical protein
VRRHRYWLTDGQQHTLRQLLLDLLEDPFKLDF